MKKILLVLSVILTGCTIVNEVKPVKDAPSMGPSKTLCIIDNPTTRESFRNSLINALEEKGYQVKIARNTQKSDCPVYITYIGKWSNDITAYISYISLTVFDNGNKVGSAYYNSTGGSAVISGKFIDSDKKIRELVDELF